MDISSMKTMLELQAIQNLNTSGDSNSSSVSSNSTLFSELIGELLSDQTGGSSNTFNGLGDMSSLQQIFESIQNGANGSSNFTSRYLTSFLLNSSPSPVTFDQLNTTKTEEATVSLEQLTTDYTSTQKYDNFLSGADKYAAEIAKAAKTYNVPEKLIAAVMKKESNFDASVVSSAGASGLMQLMPSTAKFLGVNDRFDPEQNIMGGAKYLRQMLDQFDNNVSTALAAYNAGPGNVKKYDGIPPFKETQNYVTKVMNYYNA